MLELFDAIYNFVCNNEVVAACIFYGLMCAMVIGAMLEDKANGIK